LIVIGTNCDLIVEKGTYVTKIKKGMLKGHAIDTGNNSKIIVFNNLFHNENEMKNAIIKEAEEIINKVKKIIIDVVYVCKTRQRQNNTQF
jgi:hypothetical protein